MLKNRKRKIAVALTAAMLLGSVCAGNAGAAKTASGNIAGYNVYGSISQDDSGCSAYTSISGQIGGLYASVNGRYKFGLTYYNAKAEQTNSGYSITAAKNNTIAGGLAVDATASHRVSYSGHTWSRSTDITVRSSLKPDK